MKKLLAFLSVLLIAGCGSTTAPVVEKEEIADEDKTIGEQIDEVKKELEDCEKTCNESPSAELKKQCLLSCEMARAYTEQLEKMTEGMQDKTQEELAEEMKKMYGIN